MKDSTTNDSVYKFSGRQEEYLTFNGNLILKNKNKFMKTFFYVYDHEKKFKVSKFYAKDRATFDSNILDITSAQMEQEKILANVNEINVSEEIDNISGRYILMPILIDEKDYVEVSMYEYRDGRIVIKFAYNVTEKNVQEDFQFDKIAEKIKVPAFLYDKKIKTKNLLKQPYKTVDKEVRQVIQDYRMYLNNILSSKNQLSDFYSVLIVSKLNKESFVVPYKDFKSYYMLGCLSKAPLVLEKFKTKWLKDSYINVLDTCGAFVTPKKMVVYIDSNQLKKIVKDNGISAEEEEKFTYTVAMANLWPILEYNLLRRQRTMPHNLMDKEIDLDKLLYRYFEGELNRLKVESFIMFANMQTIMDYAEEFSRLMISGFMFEKSAEINRMQTSLIELKREINLNRLTNLLATAALVVSLLFSYDAIQKVASIFFENKYATPIYLILNSIIFLSFLASPFRKLTKRIKRWMKDRK
ncbi:hypothetical protein EP56_01945 [Listeriaceae bacterium FSL A5-0209]|nr:hypothetical protein EP56_01945 [Listeriaceae bacterium FSL A5-0209]